MKKWHKIVWMVGLLLIEAIIMLYGVPKANADEIDLQLWLGIDLFLALVISSAILTKENRGKRAYIVQLVLLCVATYLQIAYCSILYEWSMVCLTLPIIQIIFGYTIFKSSHNYVSLLICSSNLLFSTIWANQMWGWLWFNNIFHELEIVAVTSLYAGAGAFLVLVVSSIMLVTFNRSSLKHDEAAK